MQCYDNFVADIYLEEQEGVYAEIDLFTWNGIATAYGFMAAQTAFYYAAGMMAFSFVTNVYYASKMGSVQYGDYMLAAPVYDWFYDATTITL